MNKSNEELNGFTMIELLMTIMIISVLGAVAIPSFLDFRNEARAAAIRQILATMRVGIKNQAQQAQLKCGIEGSLTANRFPSSRSFWGALHTKLAANDITSTLGGDIICTTAQVPNPEDRKFWDTISSNDRPRVFTFGVDTGTNINVYKNPLTVRNTFLQAAYSLTNNTLIGPGGSICGLVDANNSASAIPNSASHWIYNGSTGEIFAATNTPGINECSF